MSNLISQIASACPEDVTTEVLAYLLKQFPTCRSAFLSLVDALVNPDDYEVETQYVIDEGRPDLVLCDNKGQGIILIENKPWHWSSFTSKDEERDQLKRYAKHLKESGFQKKTLCLLATKDNRSRLLEEAQFVPPDDIKFVVITWEEVFCNLKSVCPEGTVEDFLLEDLQAWMLPLMSLQEVVVPPVAREIKERWKDVKTIVEQAKNIAENIIEKDSSLNRYSFVRTSQRFRQDSDLANFYGYAIHDEKSGLDYFFGATIAEWMFLRDGGKQSLFVLTAHFRWEANMRNGKPIIDPEVLSRQCDFEIDKRSPSPYWNAKGCTCTYPLTDSSDGHAINPEELAEALAEILRKVSGEINKGQ